MKYLLLICDDGSLADAPEEELDAMPWVAETTRNGTRLLGSRIRPAQDATTVRFKDGAPLITDGPFAETKEQICGFDIIDCADLDEAIAIAAKHPVARYGMVEVRPFWTE
ncbi:YciI family protein [Streptomyces sp. NPDC008317]|uniref:YciI family protein n=1 Tax=Streptomyces sp. NPDC008317 TaxID=3364827 RepID=UPI0036EC02DF